MSVLHEETRGISFDRFESDDSVMFVGDLGPGTEATVDIVGEKALIVLERGTDSIQRELELPSSDAQAFINNGVLTIKVTR